MSHNAIGDAGAEELARALEHSVGTSALQVLDLRCNRVGDAGGAALEDAQRATGGRLRLLHWSSKAGPGPGGEGVGYWLGYSRSCYSRHVGGVAHPAPANDATVRLLQ